VSQFRPSPPTLTAAAATEGNSFSSERQRKMSVERNSAGAPPNSPPINRVGTPGLSLIAAKWHDEAALLALRSPEGRTILPSRRRRGQIGQPRHGGPHRGPAAAKTPTDNHGPGLSRAAEELRAWGGEEMFVEPSVAAREASDDGCEVAGRTSWHQCGCASSEAIAPDASRSTERRFAASRPRKQYSQLAR
jgi:hypothetical protein